MSPLMDNFINKREYWVSVAIRETSGKVEVAEDIIQESFISLSKFAEKHGKVNGNPDDFIYATIVNAHRMYIRKNKRYEPALTQSLLEEIVNENYRAVDGGRRADSKIISDQLKRDIKEAVEQLPPTQKEYVKLWIEDSCSQRKALISLNKNDVKYNTFKANVLHARNFLMDYLTKKGWGK